MAYLGHDGFQKFFALLEKESDRGCALIGAAVLDDQLSESISGLLCDYSAVRAGLFGQSGPLGTFSAKIDLALLLGLISEDQHRDLHLIRKLRNEFGHLAGELTFDSPSIKNRCLAMCTVPLAIAARPKFVFVVVGIHSNLAGVSEVRLRLPPRNRSDPNEHFPHELKMEIEGTLGLLAQGKAKKL